MPATLKIQLFDPFTDSKFVAFGTTIEVSAAPDADRTQLTRVQESKKRTTGPTRSFTVDASGGAVFVRVVIRVPAPDGLKPAATVALTIEQQLTLTESGTTVALSPVASNGSSAAVTAKRPVHPRINFGPPAPGQAPLMRVDLTFVDLTAALRAAAKTKISNGQDDPFEFYDMRNPQEMNPSDIHYGCQLHILELTVGKPKTWLAVVPRAARAAGVSDFHVVVFYRPSFAGYRDTSDVDLRANDVLAAHLRDPPRCAPFFWWGCGRVPQWWLSNAGFEGQIEASKKPVIFVVPLPHGTVDLKGETRASASGLRKLVTSLLVALSGDGSLGATGPAAPAVRKLAVLGLSLGGSGAYAAIRKNGDTIDEVYLMDPSERLRGTKATLVQSWFTKGAKRKLRLVAGYGFKEMQDLRNKILAAAAGREKDVTISPEDETLFNTPGNFYHLAVIPRGTLPRDEQLDRPANAGAASVTKLSRETGVFLERATGALGDPSSLVVPGAKPIRKTNLEGTPIELAALVRANWFRPGAGARKPVSSAADLDRLLSPKGIIALGEQLGDGHWIRHLWASAGGIGNTARFPHGEQDAQKPDGKAFEGHLLFCLKDVK